MALADMIDFLKLRGKQKSNTLGNKAKYDMMEDTTDVFKGYLYYKNFLTEKLIKIFKYENLPPTIPQEALEDYIIHFGFAGITYNEKFGLVAVPCTKYGVGIYPRCEPLAQYCTPLMEGRNLVIGRDIVIIKNNTYQLSCIPLIERYARQLADADSSITIALENARIHQIPSFDDEESAESYKAFMIANRLGQVDTVADSSFIQRGNFVEYQTNNQSSLSLALVETRNEILRSFLLEIGITVASGKKERMVVDEVNANSQLLMFNLHDMLDNRKQAMDFVNQIYGTNISVELSEEYKFIESAIYDNSMVAKKYGGGKDAETQSN